VLGAFPIDSHHNIKVLDVVVWSANSEEGIGKLKTHIARLEALGAHRNHFSVIHVSGYEAVWSANWVVIVHVKRFREIRVDCQRLDEEMVWDDVVVHDLYNGDTKHFLLKNKIKLAILIDVYEGDQLCAEISCLDNFGIVGIIGWLDLGKSPFTFNIFVLKDDSCSKWIRGCLCFVAERKGDDHVCITI